MSLSIEKTLASRIFGKKRRDKLSRCFLKGGIAHFVHRMSHFEITHDSLNLLKPSLPDPKQLGRRLLDEESADEVLKWPWGLEDR